MPNTDPHDAALVLHPAPVQWAARAREHAAQSSDARMLFRREMGIDAHGPVVMSGHQAQWWHAGIYAKRAAACALSELLGTTPAWVVVDQDASDSVIVVYPSRANKSGGLPVRRQWVLAPADLVAELRADVALADLPTFEPTPTPADAATPGVERALRAIAHALQLARPGAPNAALQVAVACEELARTVLGRVCLIPATAITRTTAFRRLLERIAIDPHACVSAFNSAVAHTGGHGLGPLLCQRGRIELPLWRLGGGPGGRRAPRGRVFAHSLEQTPLATIAPRGPLMTAMLRHLGCDLFIHGTGGGASGEAGGYDKVAEAWFERWLGESIAPSVTATATLLASIGPPPSVTLSDVYEAQRNAHASRHSPALLGDHEAQQRKDSLVRQIAAASDTRERAKLFRALQDELAAYRSAHAQRLTELAGVPQAERFAQESVLRDRTWPWPIHSRQALVGLHTSAAALFSGQPLPKAAP